MAKVFEKLICKQLFKYLEATTYSLLNRQVLGKKQFKQPFLLILSITNKWLINMDQRYLNGIIFPDLKKAFDSTNHKFLLVRMKLYGLTEHFLKWFRFCLTNRIQVWKVDHVQSNQISIKYGVLQDSTL